MPSFINPAALNAIRALNPGQGDALLRRVLEAFLQDTPRQLIALRAAAAGSDTDAIRKAAHSLKSSSANVGAEALAKMFRELEQLARAEQTEGAADLLAQLEREFQSVRQTLGHILAKGA